MTEQKKRGGKREGAGKKPASPEQIPRTMTIRVRLTPSEYLRVMQAAQHNWQGWTATDSIRNTLLNAGLDQAMTAEAEHRKRCE